MRLGPQGHGRSLCFCRGGRRPRSSGCGAQGQGRWWTPARGPGGRRSSPRAPYKHRVHGLRHGLAGRRGRQGVGASSLHLASQSPTPRSVAPADPGARPSYPPLPKLLHPLKQSPRPPPVPRPLPSVGPAAVAPPLPGFAPATFGVAVTVSSGDSNPQSSPEMGAPLAGPRVPLLFPRSPWLRSQPPSPGFGGHQRAWTSRASGPLQPREEGLKCPWRDVHILTPPPCTGLGPCVEIGPLQI